MTLLLDTHTVLWFWWNDPRSSTAAATIICDSKNRKLVSPATAWEVAIKVSLKKLDIGGPYMAEALRLAEWTHEVIDGDLYVHGRR